VLGFKIKQTFVPEKFTISMAKLFYKWLVLIVLFTFSLGITGATLPFKTIPASVALHPFYISVTEINHNATDKSLEISCKIFYEDLEKALNTQFKTPVDLINPKDKAQTEKMIFAYLLQHFSLKINGRQVMLQYVGYEIEKEAAWCYLQVSNVSDVKQMDIMNNLLFEQFATQVNIVHGIVNGKRESTKLSNPNAVTSFEF
jgi:hypothetical protein